MRTAQHPSQPPTSSPALFPRPLSQSSLPHLALANKQFINVALPLLLEMLKLAKKELLGRAFEREAHVILQPFRYPPSWPVLCRCMEFHG